MYRRTQTTKTDSRRNRKSELELVIKKQTKAQAQIASLVDSTKHLKKNQYQFFTNSSEIRKRGNNTQLNL